MDLLKIFKTSNQNSRETIVNILSQSLNKFINILCTIISIPIIINYLGLSHYGVFIAIQSFLNWFLFDNGVSEGIKVKLINYLNPLNKFKTREIVLNGLLLLILIQLFFLFLFFILNFFLDWNVFFNTSISDIKNIILLLFFVCSFLIPLKIVREIHTANQEGYKFTNARALGSLITLFLQLLIIYYDYGFFYLIFITVLVPVLIQLIQLFIINYDEKFKIFSNSINKILISEIFFFSTPFFLYGLSRMILNTTDVFIVNFFINNQSASTFGILVRFLLYFEVVSGLVTYPLWPALRKAINTNNFSWKKRIENKLIIFKYLIITLFLVTCFFSETIIEIWIKKDINIDLILFPISIFVLFRVLSDLEVLKIRVSENFNLLGKIYFYEAMFHLILGILVIYFYGLQAFCYLIAFISFLRFYALKNY